uniref:Uncharacterized protein n=1 Tax=Biomphalaria glabrata TaxID=6526 RepID=A0A2C9LNG7_BIOGL
MSTVICHSDKMETLEEYNVLYDNNESQHYGDHETQESEGGEANLPNYLVGCKKNPGHRQFIPVDIFSLKHLPKGLQDNDLFDLIKATADLTVRVGVTNSSPHRPKFWPKTTHPYPFYNMSDTRKLRTGSGRVFDVKSFQDGIIQDGGIEDTAYTKCWCTKCLNSNVSSNVWWEFYVYTATHVVCDDFEASHTTLRLFYDTNNSQVINVDKINVDYVNIEYDLCVLKCVTCDNHVGKKLTEMCDLFFIIFNKVFQNYKNSRDIHKLNFIVSHPHGCSKQISIGQWKDIYKVGFSIKFTYTTSTCPGSSGAHVQCVGYNEWWLLSNLVHSGSLKCGLNYSGVGDVS